MPSSKWPKRVEPIAKTAAEKNHSNDIVLSFRVLVAAAVIATAGLPMGFRPSGYRRGAAALPPPRLAALPHGHPRYDQRRNGVGPPQPEQRVRPEAHQQGS